MSTGEWYDALRVYGRRSRNPSLADGVVEKRETLSHAYREWYTSVQCGGNAPQVMEL